MKLAGRKLGILISAPPSNRNFQHAVALAERAAAAGLQVFIYLIDDAVAGMPCEGLVELKGRGARLFACAYSLQKRELPMGEIATPSGLTILNDLIASTDRFVAFTA